MKYLIHTRPDPTLQEEVRAFRREVRELPKAHGFEVPHTTFYIGPFIEHCERDLLDAMESVRAHVAGVMVTELVDAESFADDAVVARLQRTPELAAVHEMVLTAVEPLLDRASFSPITPGFENRVDIHARVGSAFFGDHWNPHMTLAYAAPDDVRDVLHLAERFRGRLYEAAALYVARYTKAKKETIAEFPLRP